MLTANKLQYCVVQKHKVTLLNTIKTKTVQVDKRTFTHAIFRCLPVFVILSSIAPLDHFFLLVSKPQGDLICSFGSESRDDNETMLRLT